MRPRLVRSVQEHHLRLRPLPQTGALRPHHRPPGRDPAVTAIDTSTVTFTLNGTEVRVRADHPHLLAALREELDVISPKDGCSPSGQCGCCTVLIDAKAVVSCNLSVQKVAGATVTTLEGLPDAE